MFVHDEDKTMDSVEMPHSAIGLDFALSQVEALLKSGPIVAELTERGVNASLALLGFEAVCAYLHGDAQNAFGDFDVFLYELRQRAQMAQASFEETR